MFGTGQARDYWTVAHFLVEIYMKDAAQHEVRRAVEMLAAARARAGGVASFTSTIKAGISREDDRLICLVEVSSLEAARRLLTVALLPAGRIREISPVAGIDLLGGRHPGGDVDPRVEPELVEDVVDVRLDGPLGQE